jgi:hypothetical protein
MLRRRFLRLARQVLLPFITANTFPGVVICDRVTHSFWQIGGQKAERGDQQGAGSNTLGMEQQRGRYPPRKPKA